MAFGTSRRLKADVAEGVATVIGRLAVRRAGAVGLVRFGDGELRITPPRGARPGLVALGRAIGEGVAADGTGEGTALADALTRLGRIARLPGLVAIVSDFRDQAGWERPLGALRARHSVLAIEVGDPREAELPAAGVLALVDPETGARVEVDTRRRRVRERFAAARARAPRARGLRAAPAAHRPRHARHGRGLARDAGEGAAMSFATPLALLALLLVPIGLVAHALAQRRARRFAVRFPALPTLRAAAPGRAAAGAATCRPRSRSPRSPCSRSPPPGRATPSASPVERASVVLVTDHSGSMQATDVEPTRLAAAQRAARDFLDRIPDQVRVGAVAFAGTPDAVQAPSTDHADARQVIDGQAADGPTATGDALATALQLLRGTGRGHAPAAIVLLSDGATTTGATLSRWHGRRAARASRSTRSRSAPRTPRSPTPRASVHR